VYGLGFSRLGVYGCAAREGVFGHGRDGEGYHLFEGWDVRLDFGFWVEDAGSRVSGLRFEV